MGSDAPVMGDNPLAFVLALALLYLGVLPFALVVVRIWLGYWPWKKRPPSPTGAKDNG